MIFPPAQLYPKTEINKPVIILNYIHKSNLENKERGNIGQSKQEHEVWLIVPSQKRY